MRKTSQKSIWAGTRVYKKYPKTLSEEDSAQSSYKTSRTHYMGLRRQLFSHLTHVSVEHIKHLPKNCRPVLAVYGAFYVRPEISGKFLKIEESNLYLERPDGSVEAIAMNASHFHYCMYVPGLLSKEVE